MTAGSDKRHFARIPFDGRIRLTCDSGEWETGLADISMKGALVQRPPAWSGSCESTCRLTLLGDDGTALIRMEGQVTHVHPDHIGIACRSIDLDSIAHLKRLVQLNLGDEALLQREVAELAGTAD